MKNLKFLIGLVFFIGLFTNSSKVLLASTHTSKQTGAWDQNSTWVNNSIPNSNNNMTVNIVAPHVVTVTGNLSFNNNITINVEDGASFFVTGNVSIGQNNNHPFQFIVNGNAHIAGNLSGVGIIGGNGGLNIGGTIGGNLNYGDFAGDIILQNELIWSDGPVSPLPIDLLYFNARAERSLVSLEWATATEINNDFFTIERSTDGYNWQIMGYEMGAGNANQTLRYTFTDSNPLEGISYYRLKQTDFDGQFEYFAPVAVSLSGARSQAEILQVETQNNRLNIWISNQDAPAQLIVANLQGRILYSGQLSAADHTQQIGVDLAQNIAGEVWVIRLSNGFSHDEKKIMAR